MRTPWRALVVGLIWTMLAGAAGAQQLVITTGADGGYYDTLGSRLQAVLVADKATDIKRVSSTGSIENLRKLDDAGDSANLALTQADALRSYLDEHPDFRDEFSVLADIGSECVFLIAPKGGNIATAADLKQKPNLRVSVGGVSSGAAVTYEVMSRLDPAYRNAKVVHMDPMRSLLQLRASDFSEVDALMIVQRPRTVSPPVEVVLDNQKVYAIISIGAGDLATTVGSNGKPIYSHREVKVGFGKDHSAKFETVCTRGLLVASKTKLNQAVLDDLAKTVLENQTYIMPGRD